MGYLTDVVEDEAVQKKIDACRNDMQAGKSFLNVASRRFISVYASMIITGFHSGKSDEVMQKVSTLRVAGCGYQYLNLPEYH